MAEGKEEHPKCARDKKRLWSNGISTKYSYTHPKKSSVFCLRSEQIQVHRTPSTVNACRKSIEPNDSESLLSYKKSEAKTQQMTNLLSH